MRAGTEQKAKVYVVNSINEYNVSILRPIFSDKNTDGAKVLKIAKVFEPVDISFAQYIKDKNIKEQSRLEMELRNIVGKSPLSEEIAYEMNRAIDKISQNESMKINAIIKQLFRLHKIIRELQLANTDRIIVKEDKIGKHEIITLYLLKVAGYNVLAVTSGQVNKELANELGIEVDTQLGTEVELNEVESKTIEKLKSEIECGKSYGNIQIIGYNRNKEWELNNFLVWLAERGSQTKDLVVLKNGISELQGDIKTIQRVYDEQSIKRVISIYSDKNPSKSREILKNKESQIKHWSAKLFEEVRVHEIDTIVIYGKTSGNAELFINYLVELGKNVITITLNKKESNRLDGFNIVNVGDDAPDFGIEYPTTYMQENLNTITYNIEQEVHEKLYGDASLGIYRSDKFNKCDTIRLVTTFEELKMYWKEKADLRPHFDVANTPEGLLVRTPVFFSKLSGVGERYKEDMAELVKNPNTILSVDETIYDESAEIIEVRRGVIKHNNDFLPFKAYENEDINVKGIKKCPNYKYSILSNHIQSHIFSSIQKLIQSGYIIDSESQQVRDKILTVCLNMNKQLIELTQQLEFTGCIPKVVLVRQKQTVVTLEESILLSFLNIMGFDIVLVVPSAYRIIENNIKDGVIQEHILGKPDFSMNLTEDSLRNSSRKGFLNRIFGK